MFFEIVITKLSGSKWVNSKQRLCKLGHSSWVVRKSDTPWSSTSRGLRGRSKRRKRKRRDRKRERKRKRERRDRKRNEVRYIFFRHEWSSKEGILLSFDLSQVNDDRMIWIGHCILNGTSRWYKRSWKERGPKSPTGREREESFSKSGTSHCSFFLLLSAVEYLAITFVLNWGRESEHFYSEKKEKKKENRREKERERERKGK